MEERIEDGEDKMQLIIGENSRSEKTREDKTQKGNEANADGDNTIRQIG